MGRAIYPMRVVLRDGQTTIVKRCSVCAVEKVVSHSPKVSEFARNGKTRGGNQAWKPMCKVCQAAIEAERRNQIDVEERRRREREYSRRRFADPEQRALRREYGREYRRERMADPEFRRYSSERQIAWRKQKMKEDPTFFTVARRRERIRAAAEVEATKPTPIKSAPRVAAEPFRAWLMAYMDACRFTSAEALAEDLDLEPRRVRSVLMVEFEQVQVDIVDTAISMARVEVEVNGVRVFGLGDLYPESELQHAA